MAVFMDLQKAFDTINFHIHVLIKNLEHLGVEVHN